MQDEELCSKRKIVMLTITESCNLACSYCYQENKTKNIMPLDVAKRALEYEFSNSPSFDEIQVELFGGEPILRKKFIIDLVEWTRKRSFTKSFLFFIETNGTLVHGDFQHWLLRNKDKVYIGLSLDGTPETHNKNRSDSYDNIDIQFFAKNHPDQAVRMTVFPDTVNNLYNDIIHIYSLGFSRVDAFFAFGVNWSGEMLKNSVELQLKKLCDYYVENPHVQESNILEVLMYLAPGARHVDDMGSACGYDVRCLFA